jgi:hypothetical protein
MVFATLRRFIPPLPPGAIIAFPDQKNVNVRPIIR